MSSTKVTVLFTRKVQWDNWGRYVTAFDVGDEVEATLHDSGTLSAESPYWPGVTDIIYPDDYIVLG